MRKRDIPIELTSLLDVILIILFVLLMQAETQTGAAQEISRQAEAEIQNAQAEIQALKTERDSLRIKVGEIEREGITVGLVEENSFIVTLSIQDLNVRTLLVEIRDGETIPILVDSEDYAYTTNKLYSTIRNAIHLQEKETVFVVFQYDRSTIYQSEYLLVSNALRQLKQEISAEGIAVNYIETDIKH